VHAAALALALPATVALERLPEPEGPDGLQVADFPGPRLTPGIVAFEHPAIRRFNTWLRSHRLRGRHVPLAKPAGSVRVLCTGSSSTWGHGVPPESGRDYPTVLGALLGKRLPDVVIESVNGGVPGTNSARLWWFFREVLLAHAPDVVTLSLTYNDTHHLTQFDEGAYLARVTAPEHVQDASARRAAAELAARGRRTLTRLLTRFTQDGSPTAPLWAELEADPAVRAPPERFAENLRAWARLCAERGITLVLVAEPVRDDAPLVWKEEFRAAIASVAAEFGLLVVDPTPALLAAGPGSELFMDAVHPTPAGHAVIARVLAEALEPLLRARSAAAQSER
jgi:lysophospholipase L1-like esterase